jgi:hypothetical protein
MAIFSRGAIGGAAWGGGADWAAADGDEPPPPVALLTAVWQDEDSWFKWLCKHCSDALPPVGTLEQ